MLHPSARRWHHRRGRYVRPLARAEAGRGDDPAAWVRRRLQKVRLIAEQPTLNSRIPERRARLKPVKCECRTICGNDPHMCILRRTHGITVRPLEVVLNSFLNVYNKFAPCCWVPVLKRCTTPNQSAHATRTTCESVGTKHKQTVNYPRTDS